MARSRGFLSSHKEDEGVHGNRPWVFCMIDAFFLITMFFVMTFHVKQDEKVLPQAMAGGTGPGPRDPLVRTLPVHVMRSGAATVFRLNASEVSLDQMEAALKNSNTVGTQYIVRVSYEAGVPFGDVMSVFNACKKAGIEKCGMVPLRETRAL
jgi:biopolymer transport protein ExbD